MINYLADESLCMTLFVVMNALKDKMRLLSINFFGICKNWSAEKLYSMGWDIAPPLNSLESTKSHMQGFIIQFMTLFERIHIPFLQNFNCFIFQCMTRISISILYGVKGEAGGGRIECILFSCVSNSTNWKFTHRLTNT